MKKKMNLKKIEKILKVVNVGAVLLMMSTPVYAAEDPLSVINNLSTFIFGVIRAIGMIITGMGILQFGLAIKSHDPSQRDNGLIYIAGGILIVFSKTILDYIIG